MYSLVNFPVTYHWVSEAHETNLSCVVFSSNENEQKIIYGGKTGVILNSLRRVEDLVNKVTELQQTLQHFVTNSNGESQ